MNSVGIVNNMGIKNFFWAVNFSCVGTYFVVVNSLVSLPSLCFTTFSGVAKHPGFAKFSVTNDSDVMTFYCRE